MCLFLDRHIQFGKCFSWFAACFVHSLHYFSVYHASSVTNLTFAEVMLHKHNSFTWEVVFKAPTAYIFTSLIHLANGGWSTPLKKKKKKKKIKFFYAKIDFPMFFFCLFVFLFILHPCYLWMQLWRSPQEQWTVKKLKTNQQFHGPDCLILHPWTVNPQ